MKSNRVQIAITVSAASQSTPLSVAAAALSVGGTVSLNDPVWSFAGDNQGRGPAYGIKWMNRFFYDSERKKAILVCKYESPSGYYANVYDEATNTWTFSLWSLGNTGESGHLYESCAYDPAAGDFYDGVWNSNYLKRLSPYSSLSSWTVPITATYSGSSISQGVQTAQAWHPNLFGTGDGGVLVMHGAQLTGGKVIAWRKSTNTWSEVSGVTWSTSNGGGCSYTGAIVYMPVDDACWISVNSATNQLFRLGAGSGGAVATATTLGTTPILCTYVGNDGQIAGILMPDPAGVSNPYILEKGGTNRVWKWSGSAWTLKGYTHPFPNGSTSSAEAWCVASCAPLGVFMAHSNSYSTASRIWKPND